MIRIFFRHVWDSLKNLKRNGWMTVAAVSSVTITLILVGIFLSFILNTTKLAGELENNVRVVAYVKLNVKDQAKEIPDSKNPKKMVANPNYQKVQHEIEHLSDVKSVKFSSKEAQLKNLTKTYGKTWKMFQGDANPLYDAYIVSATSPKKVKAVAAEIKALPAINNTNYGGASTRNIFALSNTIKLWGSVAALLLLLVAVFLISNTIRITILSRSREIQIMRLVGAKNSYIRWPFFLEGAWVGLLGAIIPIVIVISLYRVAFSGLQPWLASENFHMYVPNYFLPRMAILLAAVGIIIGSLGATMSMRRFLKA